MKKKLKLIIVLVVTILSIGIFSYYQYPYWYGHRQLNNISLSDFKSKEAMVLAKDLIDGFKVLFDESYQNGVINQEPVEQYEERKKILITKGAEVILTPVDDLYKKYHVINEEDQLAIEKHIFNCVSVCAESLNRLDSKRFFTLFR